MAEDPRLYVQSETNRGTRFVRAAAERRERLKEQWPSVDEDELILARADEMASAVQWRVRIDHQDLWWAAPPGGFTIYTSNARKWPCRWDAYAYMVKEDVGRYRTWAIESAPLVGRTDPPAVGGRAWQDDLRQAWTGVLARPDGHGGPEDGLAHAITAESVPARALCGVPVTHYIGKPWPPRGLHRCERCNSIGVGMPWRADFR